MGFTIAMYSLYGLPQLANIYVTIKGSYSVKKAPDIINVPIPGIYNIAFTVYFQASQNAPVITQKDMSYSIQALPNPAVLYLVIYDYVKGQLRSAEGELYPKYGTPEETLVFTDVVL
jgi:hypothetical protein